MAEGGQGAAKNGKMKYKPETYLNSSFYGDESDIANYKEKIVKCRRPHKCMCGCEAEIKAGDFALLETGFLDGKPVSSYTRLSCMDAWLEESGQVENHEESGGNSGYELEGRTKDDFCQDHDDCQDCGVTACDNRPKRRGEDEIMSLAEAAIAQLNLPKNLAKGGWESCEYIFLSTKLDEETAELHNEIFNYWTNPTPENRKRVREEAGDVVNIVMMLADKCGALKEEETE